VLRRLSDAEALSAVVRIMGRDMLRETKEGPGAAKQRGKQDGRKSDAEAWSAVCDALALTYRDKNDAKPRERRKPVIRYSWPAEQPPSRFQRFIAWVRRR
jgi:hypothetical protein